MSSSADLSISEAAQTLGIHRNTLRRWVADGRLPAYRVGPRLLRVRAADIRALCRQIPTA